MEKQTLRLKKWVLVLLQDVVAMGADLKTGPCCQNSYSPVIFPSAESSRLIFIPCCSVLPACSGH